MATCYFRRFRMELDFRDVCLPEPQLPDGYRWLPWNRLLLERHSLVKWNSFHQEVDARVFACLSQLEGCRRLMQEISRQLSFLPGATWLLSFQPEDEWPAADCGTIQGVSHSRRLGAIQNVGVIPEHRGFGLGRALVLRSLDGFLRQGLRRVYLEVTADNQPAVELYRSIGFRLIRTMYRAVEVQDAAAF